MFQPRWIRASGHVRHQPHQFFLGRLGARELAGDAAAPQHEDAGRQVQHLRQLARDQEDRRCRWPRARRSARGSPPSRRRPRRGSARRGSGSCTPPPATSRARSSAGCRPRVRRPAARWRRSGRAAARSSESASARSAGRRMNGPRARRRRIASDVLPRALMESTRPCRLRSSGTRPRPARIAAAGDRERQRAGRRTVTRPVAPDRGRTAPAPPRIGRRRRAPRGRGPRPPQRERDVRRNPAGLERSSTRSTSAPRLAADVLREVLASGRPIIICTSVVAIELAHGLRGDVAAVAQHGDRVAQPEDLVHAVADVDARHAALLQPRDQRIQRLGLVLRQAAGRLVEDDDPGAAADRGGDLQHLLLRRCSAPRPCAARRSRRRLPRASPRPGATSAARARNGPAAAATPDTGSRRRSGSRRTRAPGAPSRCRPRAPRRRSKRAPTLPAIRARPRRARRCRRGSCRACSSPRRSRRTARGSFPPRSRR